MIRAIHSQENVENFCWNIASLTYFALQDFLSFFKIYSNLSNPEPYQQFCFISKADYAAILCRTLRDAIYHEVIHGPLNDFGEPKFLQKSWYDRTQAICQKINFLKIPNKSIVYPFIDNLNSVSEYVNNKTTHYQAVWAQKKNKKYETKFQEFQDIYNDFDAMHKILTGFHIEHLLKYLCRKNKYKFFYEKMNFCYLSDAEKEDFIKEEHTSYVCLKYNTDFWKHIVLNKQFKNSNIDWIDYITIDPFPSYKIPLQDSYGNLIP